MANTKSITDKVERKKVKRVARKKAAPKAAAHLRPWLGQAQGQEDGARTVEALVRHFLDFSSKAPVLSRGLGPFSCGMRRAWAINAARSRRRGSGFSWDCGRQRLSQRRSCSGRRDSPVASRAAAAERTGLRAGWLMASFTTVSRMRYSSFGRLISITLGNCTPLNSL